MIEKYLAVFKISWQNGLIYRLNFALWRVRSVLQLLLVYFIWWTVFQNQDQLFNYTQSSILTYIMAASLIRAIILSSRVVDISGQISEGTLINFLVKPLGVIKYYFARDLADKLLNISFVIFELILLFILLKPPIIFQLNPQILILFTLASLLGLLLYFAVAFNIGILAFWTENSWGPLFLVMIILEGFGGGLFPLDILPKSIYDLVMLTPFPYLLYFPAKLYLGNMPQSEIIQGFIVLISWIFISWYLMIRILRAGLRKYTAFGY